MLAKRPTVLASGPVVLIGKDAAARLWLERLAVPYIEHATIDPDWFASATTPCCVVGVSAQTLAQRDALADLASRVPVLLWAPDANVDKRLVAHLAMTITPSVLLRGPVSRDDLVAMITALAVRPLPMPLASAVADAPTPARRFGTTLNSLPVAVVTTTPELIVTFANAEAVRLIGRRVEDLIGRALLDAVGLHERHAELFRAALHERMAGGVQNPECRFFPAGAPHSELGLRHAGSDSQGHIFVLRDLSDLRGTEHVERLAAVSSMAAGFAHEIRNPLACLRMLCEALDAEVTHESGHELVRRIHEQVRRVERLVDTSLRFARPGHPRPEAHWASVVINRLLEAMEPKTREHGPLRVTIAPDLPKLYCDEGQLVQVLVALVNNALEASGAGDQVHVQVSAISSSDGSPRWVEFAVEDAGPGVPDEHADSVFFPFYTTKPSGTGLGLSTAQKIVLENKGRIFLATPSSGSGARFVVWMPVLQGGPP